MLADVSFGQFVWVMIEMFFLFMFIWIFIGVIADLFRDHQISGWGKAAWVIFLIFIPLLGTLVYLIARGKGMAERSMAQQAKAQADFDEYVKKAAGSGSAGELEKLAELHENGKLTDDEYEKMKAKVIG